MTLPVSAICVALGSSVACDSVDSSSSSELTPVSELEVAPWMSVTAPHATVPAPLPTGSSDVAPTATDSAEPGPPDVTSTPSSVETDEPDAGTDAPSQVVIETDPVLVVQPSNEQEITCDGGNCGCTRHSFVIETKQSCAIEVNAASADPDALPLDAESFITLEDEDFRVFALDRFGAGRIVAWCDGTTLNELARAMPLYEYLAQNDAPRLASIGYDFFCRAVEPIERPDGTFESAPSGLDARYVEYLGNSLPAAYLDDVSALAADYDGLIVCGWMMDWTDDFSEVVRSFVTQYGKGLALVGEYASNADDIAGLNAYAQGTGVVFREISIDWAPTTSAVNLDCVPGLPPPRVR